MQRVKGRLEVECADDEGEDDAGLEQREVLTDAVPRAPFEGSPAVFRELGCVFWHEAGGVEFVRCWAPEGFASVEGERHDLFQRNGQVSRSPFC